MKNNYKIMIDPYLSDSVEKINSQNYRRIGAKNELFQICLEMMIFTHNHLDHYDPDTVKKFLTPETNITVFSPLSVWSEVRQTGGKNNYVMFNRGTIWTEDEIKITAVKAEHSDAYAIGVIIDGGEKNIT